MEVVAAATIWCTFSCFLLFPRLGLPALLHRTAMTLLVAELVALAMWSYGSKGCIQRPCDASAETGRMAAGVDIPLLSLALVVVAGLCGLRAWRHERRTAHRQTRVR